MLISMIAVLSADNRVIGRNNKLLWDIPEDLHRFKRLTSGHPVIMGRKTWKSIPERFRPLPNRTNIILSQSADFVAQGAEVATSINTALVIANNSPGNNEVFIIGGGEVYGLGLPFADRLYLTLVEDDPEGNVFFPEYGRMFTRKVEEERRFHDRLAYTFLTLDR